MVAFPDVLKAFPTDDYAPPEALLSGLIETRFIERFLQFWGFVTMDPRRFINGEPIALTAQTQPLLEQTFQFHING
ncbi:hypothetical protein BZG81_00585 [Salinivibrio sp. MA607]|nr:hypothetical protein BZG81_00585 [Salinivibrio sp. MA607]